MNEEEILSMYVLHLTSLCYPISKVKLINQLNWSLGSFFDKDKEDGEDVLWGQSAAAKVLAKWTGKGNEFSEKFAGDPSRDGTLFIRETEELYTGTITALDDSGKKEAELNFKEGKWDGAITKWDLEGNIWEKGEFTAGKLIGFEIKEGKPFDPNQIIESSPFGN